MYSQELVTLVIVSFVFAVGPSSQVNPMTVCEVLSAPEKYDGKIVTIEGYLVSSSGDTAFDEMTPSQRCPTAKGPSIGIMPPDHHFLSNPPTGWSIDPVALERAAKRIAALVEKKPTLRRIPITVEGFIYDGGEPPQGLIRHPWHRAHIVISAFKEIPNP